MKQSQVSLKGKTFQDGGAPYDVTEADVLSYFIFNPRTQHPLRLESDREIPANRQPLCRTAEMATRLLQERHHRTAVLALNRRINYLAEPLDGGANHQ